MTQIAVRNHIHVHLRVLACLEGQRKYWRDMPLRMYPHNVWAVGLTFAIVPVFLPVLWRDICESQPVHAFNEFVHQLGRKVHMQVMNGEAWFA